MGVLRVVKVKAEGIMQMIEKITIMVLDSALEPIFLDYASQDVRDYYFFVYDWRFHRDSTEILLALKGYGIEGLMLIYKRRMVQLRGSAEAVKALMEHLNLEKASIQAPREHEPIILSKYRPSRTREIVLMTLRRGEEKLYIKHAISILSPKDAEEIAELLRQSSADWAETTADQVAAEMERGALWLGIRQNGNIASVGNTHLVDLGSNIGRVATHSTNRGKGYATSVVSTLVKEILQRSEYALIHVLSDNLPAKHVYMKVGFKPYKTYLLMEGEKITPASSSQLK